MAENKSPQNSGGLFQLNAVLLLVTALLLFAAAFEPGLSRSPVFASAYAGASLFIAFPLFGVNFAAVLLPFFRTVKLAPLEKINVAAVLAFIGAPMLLIVENSVFGILSPGLPLLHAALLFPIALWINPRFLDGIRLRAIPRDGIGAVISYILIVSGIVFAYIPLPDYDPYYWIPKLELLFATHQLVHFSLSRPFFSAFVYIFSETSGVDLYFAFKYVFPFLVLFTLLPLSLAASAQRNVRFRWLFHLLPFAGASFALYTLAPIPQGIANILLITFAAFLLYAWQSGKDFFFFAAGMLVFLAYFYHEVTLIAFFAWLLVAGLAYRKTLAKILLRRWALAVLLLALSVFALKTVLYPLFTLASFWVSTLVSQLFPAKVNFLFPFRYVNIDGNEVGWGSLLGVAKYYLFYGGPAALVGGIVTVLLVLRVESRKWHIPKEPAVLALALLFFFLIAEVLPRLFSFALLPERAFGIASFFLVALSLPLFARSGLPWMRLLRWLFVLSIILNVGGALYINYQKKFLIPPSQIASAEWINEHLPQDRLFLSDGHVNLLQVHARSGYVNVEKLDFYRNPAVFDKLLECLSPSGVKGADEEAECARFIRQSYPPLDDLRSDSPRNIFIYYARPDSRNPYRSRPYFASDLRPEETSFVFDRNPERFKRLYSLPEDEIVIWQYLR